MEEAGIQRCVWLSSGNNCKSIMSDFDLMTLDEVAVALRVKRPTISRLIGGGHLPHLELGSRRLVRQSDLRRFIESRMRGLADGSLIMEGL